MVFDHIPALKFHNNCDLPSAPRMTNTFGFMRRLVVSVLALTVVKVVVAQTISDAV
jgi:hypothetical protein